MPDTKQSNNQEEVSSAILTVPNVISFIRLCMVPVFLYFFMQGEDIIATVLFATAAATDFVDGQIARRTHCITKLGQLLDPTVDRALMIFGVVGLLVTGRLPIWIVVVVLVRDLYLLFGGYYLLKVWRTRVSVIYAGKFATTCLFIGFAGLVLNMPQVPGLGLIDVAWLPGFNCATSSWSIWFVYLGLCIDIYTTVYYTFAGFRAKSNAQAVLKAMAHDMVDTVESATLLREDSPIKNHSGDRRGE